jgi:anti-sigma regulatory factor (Ser/Thr protein kinase)
MGKPDRWFFDAPDATGALRMRSDFVRYLKAYGGATDDYADAEAIFGELVGNVVLHAPGTIEILVDWPGGRAMLHVTDEGMPINAEARALPAGPYDEHGRGLLIVDKLSQAVSNTVYPGFGKMVSASLPVRCH